MDACGLISARCFRNGLEICVLPYKSLDTEVVFSGNSVIQSFASHGIQAWAVVPTSF